MRYEGKLTHWNDAKGFGFISPAGGGKSIFVHINEFHHSDDRPSINEVITFNLSQDKTGRPCAVDAKRQGKLASNHRPLSGKKAGLPVIIAGGFLTTLAALALTDYIPDTIFLYYVSVSLLTLLIYGYDKAASMNGKWRTQESTLHLLALIGGWPGAMIAQDKLRHKSKKQEFRIVFWITALMNCGVLIWLLTPDGATFLKQLIIERYTR